MFHSALHFNQERRLSVIFANWLGRGENDAWTGRDLARVVSVKGGRADAGGMAMSGVETIAPHATEVVRARGRAVQSLRLRPVLAHDFQGRSAVESVNQLVAGEM